MTPEEKQEVLHILEAHEHTLAVCRACAETTRELAWEIRRGHVPEPEALRKTIEESERVLAELGRVEIALAQMKASLW
jgi:predicted metal-binding protein